MKKVLIVEDDEDIRELLQNFLQEAGYAVAQARDGVEAMAGFHKEKIDLVLLDVMLPKIDGYGVCELIRKESRVPIMMMTALDGEADQIKGFDLLADDYITKPFSMPVLLRRIAALLRRAELASESGSSIGYKEITLDLDAYKASVGERPLDLTSREFELLRELLTRQGKVLTRRMLLDRVWGPDHYGDERIVDTHIKNLRHKLGLDYIETIRGVGYRIDKEDK